MHTLRRFSIIAWLAIPTVMYDGFFLHMTIGQPGAASLGTTITTVGAALLAGAILPWSMG